MDCSLWLWVSACLLFVSRQTSERPLLAQSEPAPVIASVSAPWAGIGERADPAAQHNPRPADPPYQQAPQTTELLRPDPLAKTAPRAAEHSYASVAPDSPVRAPGEPAMVGQTVSPDAERLYRQREREYNRILRQATSPELEEETPPVRRESEDRRLRPPEQLRQDLSFP